MKYFKKIHHLKICYFLELSKMPSFFKATTHHSLTVGLLKVLRNEAHLTRLWLVNVNEGGKSIMTSCKSKILIV